MYNYIKSYTLLQRHQRPGVYILRTRCYPYLPYIHSIDRYIYWRLLWASQIWIRIHMIQIFQIMCYTASVWSHLLKTSKYDNSGETRWGSLVYINIVRNNEKLQTIIVTFLYQTTPHKSHKCTESSKTMKFIITVTHSQLFPIPLVSN